MLWELWTSMDAVIVDAVIANGRREYMADYERSLLERNGVMRF